ncbi:MAG: hypothetical protein AAGJ93_03005 [Bacteroidota bacterium]
MKLFWNTVGILTIYVILILSSCNLINPEEDIPAYLEIAPFTLTTNLATQGSASEKITEAWVFIDGVFLGVYDLPATVPVLQAGVTEVTVEAGIRDNGISSTPEIYPFYEAYEVNLDLVPGETFNVQPQTQYLSNTKFALIEDFEDNRPRLFTQQILGSGEISLVTADAFEGQYSGFFGLSKENQPILEISTELAFSELQEDGVFVYLEVNYRSDAPVLWGIVGETDAITGLERYYGSGFTPKAEWNKIYFNLSQSIFDSQLDEFQVGLQAFLRVEDPDTANVYLDNIKLVHF